MTQPANMSIPQAMELAGQFIRARRLAEAETIYRQVLQQQPTNSAAVHGLALIAHEVGNRDAALQLVRHAIELNPNVGLYYQNLAELLQFRGETDAAERAFRRAIELDPRLPHACMKLGLILESKNLLDEALELYRKTIFLAPRLAEGHCNLADVLLKLGEAEKAVESYTQGIALDPNLAAAYSNRAAAHERLGRLQEAFEDAQRAVRIDPNMFAAFMLMGRLCYQNRQNDQAIEYFRQAIRIEPNSAPAHNGLGIAYFQLGRFDEACDEYQKAIQIDPKMADAYTNLGLAMSDRGRFDEAIAAYDKAIELDMASGAPTASTSTTHANRGLALLVSGKLEEGFAEYDYRWNTTDFATAGRDYECPRWEGQNLTGKTILLWHEQGLGDTIQFIRYASILMQHGANQVIVEAQPPLHSLLRNVRGVSEVISRKDALPQGLDFHAPFMRLPGLLKTTLETIPHNVPYVNADPELVERWKTIVEAYVGLRVGIAWQGRIVHRLDRQRSVTLERFLPLSRIPGMRLFSLQFEEGSEQSKSAIAEQMQLIDLTHQVKDFSDSAALIQNLDLVIAIDTAVVHLAGAMAKPVWTLLSFAPDFRWMLKREDSPWYPTMRLIRQATLGDWDSAIERIVEALKEFKTGR